MAGEPQKDPIGQAEGGLFAVTHWSMVLRARDKSQAALNTLRQTYRQPIIKLLRGRGYSLEEDEDLVQEFLARGIERDFLKNVAQEKGVVRTSKVLVITSVRRRAIGRKFRASRQTTSPLNYAMIAAPSLRKTCKSRQGRWTLEPSHSPTPAPIRSCGHRSQRR